jgi:hypothetical protein
MTHQLTRDNTYNSENDLSSELNITIYGADENCDWCWADDIYVALSVHLGGDVRGNYGGVRIYRADSLADTGFLDWTLGWHVETAELSGVDQDDLGKKHLEGLTWAVDDNLTERCSPGYANLPSSELYKGTTDDDSCYWQDGSAYLTDGETVWKATPYHYQAKVETPENDSAWICDARIDIESFLTETLGEPLEIPDNIAECWDWQQEVEDWITQQEMAVE